jgi:hypothetical protein
MRKPGYEINAGLFYLESKSGRLFLVLIADGCIRSDFPAGIKI